MHACLHACKYVCMCIVYVMCLSERLHEELQREKDVANKPHMHLHGMSCAAFFFLRLFTAGMALARV